MLACVKILFVAITSTVIAVTSAATNRTEALDRCSAERNGTCIPYNDIGCPAKVSDSWEQVCPNAAFDRCCVKEPENECHIDGGACIDSTRFNCSSAFVSQRCKSQPWRILCCPMMSNVTILDNSLQSNDKAGLDDGVLDNLTAFGHNLFLKNNSEIFVFPTNCTAYKNCKQWMYARDNGDTRCVWCFREDGIHGYAENAKYCKNTSSNCAPVLTPSQEEIVTDLQFIWVSVGLGFSAGVLLIVVVCCCRHQERSRKVITSKIGCTNLFLSCLNESGLTSIDYGRNFTINSNKIPRLHSMSIRKLVPPELWIDVNCLSQLEHLADSNFGRIFQAWYRRAPDAPRRKVAVKALLPGSQTDPPEFIAEGNRMDELDHRNVLRIIGISECLDGPLIILPFMEMGNLEDYLKDRRNDVTVRQLLDFAADIAHGMRYLHKRRIVHRDLACRNCLLDESLKVKISDFGLSRDIYEMGTYISEQRGDLPARWMALESLTHGINDEKTDVWSFGVVLWEMFTRCQSPPYQGHSYYTMLEFLKNGNRLYRPAQCPEQIYEIMSRCWDADRDKRVKFSDLCSLIPSTSANLAQGVLNTIVSLPDEVSSSASTVQQELLLLGHGIPCTLMSLDDVSC